jgi:hypothetical protein
VFLVDNQRYVRKNDSLRNNLAGINDRIVEPFYNVLCAGEEKKPKYIGSRVLDAGDIIQSISGWTVIGYGSTALPSFRLPFRSSNNYLDKSSELNRGIEAMDEAISQLSLKCRPEDASRAVYLVSAPSKEMNVSVVGELGEYLRSLTPDAILRNGDYPRGDGALAVSVILSELRTVQRVQHYYAQTSQVVASMTERRNRTGAELLELDMASANVPSLLDTVRVADQPTVD